MPTLTPEIQRWAGDRPADPRVIEGRMRAEGLPYYRWSNGPGDVYGAHHHGYDKVIHVLEGDITFGLPELNDRVSLHAGDRLYLPAGVVHDAVVGAHGVVCLEAHQPV